MLAEGETLGDSLPLGETLALGEGERETEPLGLILALGDGLSEALLDGLTEGDGDDPASLNAAAIITCCAEAEIVA